MRPAPDGAPRGPRAARGGALGSLALSTGLALAAGLALPGAALARGPSLVVLAKPKPPKKKPPAPPPLKGKTHDFHYDGKDVGHPERAYHARTFVPDKALGAPATARPVVVFIHGLNTELIKYRWAGGGNEGDVRRIVGDLVDAGSMAPAVLVAPSSIVPSSVNNAVTCWPELDVDRLLDRAESELKGVTTLDRKRVIVAGHSGGGCNTKGGVMTALKTKSPPLAAFVIDACMLADSAKVLAGAPSVTHVVVSYQTMSWQKRGFSEFTKLFDAEVKKSPPGPALAPVAGEPKALRLVEKLVPKEPMPHDAMVPLVFRTWLPKVLPPAPPPRP